MKVVYIEAVLMDNDELIHFGKSLGFVSERQRELVESDGAAKLTKGGEPIVSIKSQRETAELATAPDIFGRCMRTTAVNRTLIIKYMGITIHHTIATEKQLVKRTLDHAEKVANTFKKQADSLGYDFEIERLNDFDLLVNVQGCETLRFNFVTFDEQWSEGENDWLTDKFRSKWMPFEQSEKTSDHYKQWPGQTTYWTSDFCKTQYGEGYICHIWIAEIIRAVASSALIARVYDEGDFYHTRDTSDAVGALKENQALIDSMAETFEKLGYEVKKHDNG